MNRNDEYKALFDELDETPLKLDYTLERALARKGVVGKRKRVKNAFFIPLGTLAAMFLVFTTLVNLSPAFASVCSEIPILSRLVEAVSMSPSLTKAIENDFVQEIGQEQTKDGVTARIKYVIVDQKQLNIFYTLECDKYQYISADAEISGVPHGLGYGASWNAFNASDDTIRKVVVDFDEDNMPSSLKLTLEVYDDSKNYAPNMDVPEQNSELTNYLTEHKSEKPDYFTEFSFDLTFDPSFTAAGKAIAANKSFEIDGQKLTLDSVEIYPTHTRFHFSADENNTAWLKDLDFYFENEKGERFDGICNAVTSMGEPSTPMMSTYMLDSTYFYDADKLSLHITGAVWLDKDKERMHINLADGTAENLPQGVTLSECKKYENGWRLGFSGAQIRTDESCYQVVGNNCYDAAGNKYEIYGMTMGVGGYIDPTTGVENANVKAFEEHIELLNYNYDEVWISLMFTSRTQSTQTIELNLK